MSNATGVSSQASRRLKVVSIRLTVAGEVIDLQLGDCIQYRTTENGTTKQYGIIKHIAILSGFASFQVYHMEASQERPVSYWVTDKTITVKEKHVLRVSCVKFMASVCMFLFGMWLNCHNCMYRCV
jgi:hypothetical protein